MTLLTLRRAPGDSFREDFEAAFFAPVFFAPAFFAAVFLPELFFFAAMLSLPGTKGRRNGLPFFFNATWSPS
jgi:hypothetical protein